MKYSSVMCIFLTFPPKKISLSGVRGEFLFELCDFASQPLSHRFNFSGRTCQFDENDGVRSENMKCLKVWENWNSTCLLAPCPCPGPCPATSSSSVEPSSGQWPADAQWLVLAQFRVPVPPANAPALLVHAPGLAAPHQHLSCLLPKSHLQSVSSWVRLTFQFYFPSLIFWWEALKGEHSPERNCLTPLELTEGRRGRRRRRREGTKRSSLIATIISLPTPVQLLETKQC